MELKITKKPLYIISLICLFIFVKQVKGQDQYESFIHVGEFGGSIGAAHYFGDLNTRAKLNRPKFAASLFFRRQLGDYVAFRLAATYARVGYSDIYNKNEFQRRRNLSFNSNIWEFAAQGDFNFFKFNPADPYHRFTPYITLGIGFMSYDPYAYLDGKKYFLRPLGTEGQGSAQYPDRKPYSTMAATFPIGAGFKVAINDQVNVYFEVLHRLTTTDYLDDVSTTYAGANIFKPTDPAYFLQDRSYETGTPIGTAGQQRGFSKQKDQFVTAMIGVSLSLSSYKCPSAN